MLGLLEALVGGAVERRWWGGRSRAGSCGRNGFARREVIEGDGVAVLRKEWTVA